MGEEQIEAEYVKVSTCGEGEVLGQLPAGSSNLSSFKTEVGRFMNMFIRQLPLVGKWM